MAASSTSPGAGRRTSTSGCTRSTTGAIRRTRRRRCRCSSAPMPATAICSTRSPSTPPTRSTRSASCAPAAIWTAPQRPGRQLRLHRPPRRRERAAPLRPAGRHLLRRRHARRLVPVVGHDWYWDVNGVWGRNNAEQDVHGNVNAANLARALGPVAACTAPCVPLNIFGGAGSITPGDARLCRLHPARQQPPAAVGLHRQLSRRPVRPAGRHRRLRDRLRASRPVRPLRPRSGRRRRPRLRHPGAADLAAATMSTRPSPSFACRCSSDTPFFHRLELTGAARYSDYSTSGSTTTFSAGDQLAADRGPAVPRQLGGGLPGAEHRRIVRHAVALRPGDRRSLLRPDRRRRRPPSAPIASPTASRPRQLRAAERAAAGDHRRQRQPRAGDVGKLGLRRGLAAELPAAPSASRPIISTSRSTARSQAIDAEVLLGRCAADWRRPELRRDQPHRQRPGHPDPRPAPEHRQHRDRRPRPHPHLPHRRRSGGDVRPVLEQHLPVQLHVTVPATAGVTRSTAKAPSRAAPTRPSRSGSRPPSSTGR